MRSSSTILYACTSLLGAMTFSFFIFGIYADLQQRRKMQLDNLNLRNQEINAIKVSLSSLPHVCCTGILMSHRWTQNDMLATRVAYRNLLLEVARYSPSVAARIHTTLPSPAAAFVKSQWSLWSELEDNGDEVDFFHPARVMIRNMIQMHITRALRRCTEERHRFHHKHQSSVFQKWKTLVHPFRDLDVQDVLEGKMQNLPQGVESPIDQDQIINPKFRFKFWRHCAETRFPNQVELVNYSQTLRESSAHEHEEDITIPHQSEDARNQDAHLQHVINEDIRRTQFDQIPFSLSSQMSRLIQAFVYARPEVGYCQGMISLFTTLLFALNFREDQAFQSFCILVDCYGFQDIYRPGMEGALLRFFQFTRILDHHCPVLSRHWLDEEITVDMFCPQWFISIFADCNDVPMETRSHLVDLLFQKGWSSIMQVSLGLVEWNMKTLDRASFEDTLQCLSSAPSRAEFMQNHLVLKDTALSVITEEEMNAFEAAFFQEQGHEPSQGQSQNQKLESCPDPTNNSKIKFLVNTISPWKM